MSPIAIVVFLLGQQPDAAALEHFERSVRPVLAERCYECHSARAKKLRGGLLLDSRAGWMRGGESGPVIVPGDPDASRLVRAVRYRDDKLRMPPGGKLAEGEIAALVAWVAMGAPDPRAEDSPPPPAPAGEGIDIEAGRRFWAFQPLAAVEPPAVQDESWCRTPVDRFVLAKLEEHGIPPNSPAGRRQLIRRAALDLIGLPPEPAEVEAFVGDPAPDAWEQAIERLLSSPHYGERWARHWLDLARFAESHGFEHDYDRPYAYHYRDFVIRALNQDMPYDRFVRLQIAGDEFEPDSPLAMMATGFLAAGVHNTQITKNQVEKERYDELDDMGATTGTVFLGLTVGCARCHDHKFDPIPTRDYYRLISSFTTTVRSDLEIDLDPEGTRRAREAFDLEQAPLEAALRRFEEEELPRRLESWISMRGEGRAASSGAAPAPPPVDEAPRWLILDLESFESKGGAAFTRLEDGSILASGKNPDHDTVSITARTCLPAIAAVRVEALAHESMAKSGPGRAGNGNFALSDLEVTVAPLAGGSGPSRAKLANPRATFEQKGLPAAAAIDGDAKSAWAVDPEFGKDHAAAFDLERPAVLEGGALLTFKLRFENNTGHGIGRLRLSIAAAPGADPTAAAAPQNEAEIDAILERAGGDPAAAGREQLLRWYRALDPEWRRLRGAVDAHTRRAPRPNLEKVLVASEGVAAIRLHTQGGDFLPETYYLRRGDPGRKEGVAEQGFLQVLVSAPEGERRWQEAPPEGWRTSYRRRALANWLTDAERGAGHLLARVIVNRLWQHHFGRGIVSTPSDFGTQGDRPTHPELLDWLAAELIRGGWRLKPIHKLLMSSAAYRMDGSFDERKQAADPDDRLLWRWRRRRLEAESIRDAALAASGILDRTMFGPGTLKEDHKRRSIYFTVKRSQLIPMMTLFDAPDALQSIGKRSSTTVAPQALLLMNNPFLRECARTFAQRVDPGAAGAAEEAVRSAYAIALSRPPTAEELAASAAFIREQAAFRAAAGEERARELALADFCQVILGLNEFIYLE